MRDVFRRCHDNFWRIPLEFRDLGCRDRDLEDTGINHQLSVALHQRRIEEVHRRAAHKASYEHIAGVVIKIEWRIDLHQLARIENADTRSHRHRFNLIVRDIDKRRPEALVQLADERARFDAKLRVEVRQRFVHQEDLRLADDRAAYCDALPLTAGELTRATVEQMADTEAVGCALYTFINDMLWVWRSFRPNAILSNTVMCGYKA